MLYRLVLFGGDYIRQPAYITNDEAHAIIERLEEPFASMCLFMLATGARISDTVNLRASRVKARMTIKERKTRKKRVVELPVSLVKRIRELEGFIYAFESRHRVGWYQPLSRQLVNLRIREAAQELGISASPHSFRHLYARNLYERVGCMEHVQRDLQHFRISTTEGYVKR
jgi:integrase